MANIIVHLEKGAILAKVDIESAYHLILVHPHNRQLQAVIWQGQIFVDQMLPFGLRWENVVADALHCYLHHQGISNLLHYLDSLSMVGPPGSPICQQYLNTLLQICGELHVPIAAPKTVGLANCLVLLGIEIDTIVGELRLSDDKLARLQSLLAAWGNKKYCTRRELESLGLLNHACIVVRAGHSFLYHMIDTLHARPHATRAACSSLIRLNKDFQADLAWWQCFVKS